jgi:predicted regulator of amino acid metabolism with ACT domain
MESKNKARQKYNFSFQLRVIKFAEEKGKHAAAKFFNVDRKRVAACPENVCVHGNYNPILKNLLPVTVANSLPPLLRKKLNTLLIT